jgi:hypothetical protein
MPTNYRKPPSFKFQRPTAIDFCRDFIGGLQREKPGICGGPWCPGPLSVPEQSHEKASQVVWLAIPSEMLPPCSAPSLHIIEAEDPVGKLGHGFKVPV